MIARIYFAARRVWYGGYALAEAAFTGFWLGILGDRSLADVDDTMYRRSATYRDDAYNRSGLFAWEAEAVESYFGDARRLMLIGAGGGREVLALAKMGYTVDGYECNPALVSTAAALLSAEYGTSTSDRVSGESEGATVLAGEIGGPAPLPRRPGAASVTPLSRDEVPAAGGPYDGAIMGWSAYMLIPGSERRIRFLRRLRALMGDGAPLLLSFYTRDGDPPRLHRIARTANALRRLLRREPVDLGDDLSPNRVHRFTEPEVARELREAGFTLLHFRPEGPGRFDSGWSAATANASADAASHDGGPSAPEANRMR
jgi:hypothetical protein